MRIVLMGFVYGAAWGMLPAPAWLKWPAIVAGALVIALTDGFRREE